MRNNDITLHSPLSTLHCPKGITLIEVLASIFVISIGLLGVLAVIPFGIFQVSKAREAENTANMLAAAADDAKLSGMTIVTSWPSGGSNNFIDTVKINGKSLPPGLDKDGDGKVDSGKGGNGRWSKDDLHDGGMSMTLDCSRVFVVDPLGTTFPDAGSGNTDRFSKVDLGTPIDRWREIVRGQDDLVFTTHRTRLSRAIEKRTDFSGQGNTIASSGKYTWFCTFSVEPTNGFTGTGAGVFNAGNGNNGNNNNLASYINHIEHVGAQYWPDTIDVDLIGCYNRVPDDPIAEREVDVTGYMQTLNGAQITLKGAAADLDLSKTKQIFVSWSETIGSGQRYVGRWCNVAYAPKNLDRNGAKTIVVTNNPNVPALPDTIGNTPRALIVDGIIYHKRVDGMPLF